MPSNLEPVSSSAEIDGKATRLSRSPHPYHRWSEQQQSPSTAQDQGYLPSPEPTPSPSDTEDDTIARAQALKSSPDESGTEVEDEVVNLFRALPAPPIKPRKGLRRVGDLVAEGELTPLLTPSQLHEQGRRLSDSYFEARTGLSPTLENENPAIRKQAQHKFRRRRQAELLRRASELLSLCSIGYVVFSGQSTSPAGLGWNTEFLYPISIVFVALLLYPLRLLLYPLVADWKLKLGSLAIPATFDPAPILYPPFLPILVALSLADCFPETILPNVVLGLSALPPSLIPLVDEIGSYNTFHWLIASVPLWNLQSQYSSLPSGFGPQYSTGFDAELLTLLFPLHQALLRPLHYLTTTSLLPSELQLLSVSLINLLLLSNSSQSNILRNILWIGGLGMFFSCQHVLKWNVALERIPNWRLRRAGRIMATASIFLTSLSEGSMDESTDDGILVNGTEGNGVIDGVSPNFTVAGNDDALRVSRSPTRSRMADLRSTRGISDVTNLNMPRIKVSDDHGGSKLLSPQRTRTSLKTVGPSPPPPSSPSGHERRMSQNAQSYSSLTPKHMFILKWGYALYTYVVAIFMILIPIRIAIGYQALNGHEAFGWAIGYLFGNVPGLGPVARSIGVDSWLALPQTDSLKNGKVVVGWVDQCREFIGLATTRILLFGYWTIVIALGLLTVLYGLKSTVEVDTRRKVFHGMMVLMLLPSTYVDPCFLALGLVLVLAVFLILDLFRASQLKPLSRPLAKFLTPYVDGRDLRGPVVVSHIFLLIGCAIPLWLSLAGIERRQTPDSDPWKGWELETRDVSMVSGVVCVGMGDAAASLVGRRFGRHKWPWAGGKSLEGSAAFAVAVSLGLVAGKAWLKIGGWTSTYDDADAWTRTMGKAVVAASGASFTEAVLTGANDNVVVPVVLWLLVRGLRL